MKNELQNKLINKYPEFFEYLKDYKGPIMPIQFGFECGDGWYWLLKQLMGRIHSYCKLNKKEYTQIHQIKEKFGGLRFYTGGCEEYIYGMISLAEGMSYHVCETCGSTKHIGQTSGWITTLCKECADKLDNTNWKEYEEKD